MTIIDQLIWLALIVAGIFVLVVEILYIKLTTKKLYNKIELTAKYLTVSIFILIILSIIF